MAKAKVQNSGVLTELGGLIGDIETDMENELAALNRAFDAAQESWKDKNATVCADALSAHNSEMREALGKLQRISSAVARLSELAAMYEDI